MTATPVLLDPYRGAYLSGGRSCWIRVMTHGLMQAGYLDVAPGDLVAPGRAAGDTALLEPAQLLVMDSARCRPRLLHLMEADRDLTRSLAAEEERVRDDLVRAGLLHRGPAGRLLGLLTTAGRRHLAAIRARLMAAGAWTPVPRSLRAQSLLWYLALSGTSLYAAPTYPVPPPPPLPSGDEQFLEIPRRPGA